MVENHPLPITLKVGSIFWQEENNKSTNRESNMGRLVTFAFAMTVDSCTWRI